MTEQERPPRTEPTTEAGRSIIGHDYRGNEVYTITREGVIAIEEAARTEGRQQAVREIRDEWESGFDTPSRLTRILMEHDDEREDGDCECGQPMSAHAGGFALLHHDEVIARLRAAPPLHDPTGDES